MQIAQLLSGMVDLKLISADLQHTLQKLNDAGIEIFHFQQEDFLTGSFQIKRRDYRRVISLCEKTEGNIRLLGRTGIYWQAVNLVKRPVLLLGFLTILLLTQWLPSCVLFVQVDGNERIPTKQILAAAEDCGICFGASRRQVRSEKVKNALLSSIPQLQWVGVNTSGCVATISVRERDPEIQSARPSGVSSIVADRDGFILSASATKGSLKVSPGQTVLAGQVLVSGYTDCGITIRAEQAEGEIYAQTNRELKAVMPLQELQKTLDGKVKKKISLLIGKKRINLWKDSGISVPGCGRMYTEYYITLPGGFRLPAAVCVERFLTYEEVLVSAKAPQTETALSGYAQRYLCQRMSSGQILEERTEIMQEDGKFILEGSYICREMIGRIRVEQMGETNG